MLVGLPAVAVVELERALAAYVHGRGRDLVHPALVDLADDVSAAVRDLSLPSAANVVDAAATLTYTEAGDRLGVSTSTMYRLARRHQLAKVGRRLLTVDIEALARGEHHGRQVP